MAELAAGLAAAVIEALRTRAESVATAESLTGGGVCAALTSVPRASDVVRGGLIVYADDVKVALAGVPRELLRDRGAVDPDVAARLADAAREQCGADWGLGLTGVAGPGPSGGVPAGTVYIAVAGPGGSECRLLQAGGGRAEVRAAAVELSLSLLKEHLTGTGR